VVFSAFCFVIDAISSSEADVSSMEAACWDDESESTLEMAMDCPTASPIFFRMVLTDSASSPISSRESTRMSWVRSPSATFLMTSTDSFTGFEISLAMARLTATASRMTTASTTANKLSSLLESLMEPS